MTPPPDRGPWPVLDAATALPLHDRASTRNLEAQALSGLPPHALMQRAGRSVASLARALAPHARNVLVLAGPGNNGGDGLVAATQLRRLGLDATVWLLSDATRLPSDAADAYRGALALGVPFVSTWPEGGEPDLVIDSLLGLGASRPPAGAMADAIARLSRSHSPVLSVDGPTGLDADTGVAAVPCVRATWTLSLLTLKPGLFTAQGRDHTGEVWFDDLGVAGTAPSATSWLGPGSASPAGGPGVRLHAQHKGSFGDTWVVGGAAGMTGAAALAAEAALLAGAGRVYVSLLGGAQAPLRPELMSRACDRTSNASLLSTQTVVCGCGGGRDVADRLPAVLSHAARLVLDADALNAVARDGGLQEALVGRATSGMPTVLTPHPLEAARLLGVSTAAVQHDRLTASQQLSERFRAVIVLKGSGTLVTAPGERPWINPCGNGALATPGSGDVLAGWLGGTWSQVSASPGRQAVELARDAARHAVWVHARAADRAALWLGPGRPLAAGDLAGHMARVAD